MLLSLVIPTYNERRNISSLIARVTAVLEKKTDSFEIIVVDDDSPDGTWQVAEELAKSNSRVRVLRRRGKRGLASAVVAGWEVARGEIVGVMDGDLQHPPETLTSLLDPIINNETDVAIASRHVEGGGISGWGLHRRFLSRAVSRVAKLMLRGILPPLRDPMSGYFLVRRTVIQGRELKPKGYKILLEVLAKGAYPKILEIPYTFVGRKEGRSKAGPKQCFDSLVHFWRLPRQPSHNTASALSSNHFGRLRESLSKPITLTRLDVLVLAAVILSGVPKLPQPFSSDQTTFILGAENMRDGAVLYRDLWDVKQPGIFYFYLIGGWLFGFSEIGIHLFELIYMVAFAAILMLILKSHFNNQAVASLVPLFTVGMYFAVSGDWHQTQPESLVGIPTFFSLWFAFKFLESGGQRRLWLFMSGIMGGVVLVFKFMFLPILAAFWLTTLRRAVMMKGKPPLITVFQTSLPVAAGVLLPLLLMMGHLARDRVLNLALWTFFDYPVIALKEWPLLTQISYLISAVRWFIGNFAPLMALATIGAYASWRKHKDFITLNLILWLVLGLLTILVQRLSWWQYHFLLLFVPLGILGARGVDFLLPRLKQSLSKTTARESGLIAALSLILLFSPILIKISQTSMEVARHGFLTKENRLSYQSNANKEYRVALEEVAFLWEPGSLPGDIYVFGPPQYYYLSGRDPAIPILERLFCPPDLWARILELLYQNRPPYIFVSKSRLADMREHTPRAALYIIETARFISKNYAVLRESNAGTWYVLRHNDGTTHYGQLQLGPNENSLTPTRSDPRDQSKA